MENCGTPLVRVAINRGGSVIVRICLGATLGNSCTAPEGHSMRRVSMLVALPRPKWASNGPAQKPSLVLISRSCQKVLPPMDALARTLAPMAERLETVPTNLTRSQALLFPLFRYNTLAVGKISH